MKESLLGQYIGELSASGLDINPDICELSAKKCMTKK